VPAQSVGELIALARSRPGALNYASGGIGSTPHLAAALFAAMARIRIAHVPYKGTGPAVTDLLGGQVQMAVLGIPTVLPHVRSGKLRPLAVTGKRRSPELPEVPTVDEAGVAGYEVSPWYGLLAPAATPSAIVARLSAEVNAVVRRAEFKQKLAAQGAEPEGSTPEEFAAYLRAEAARWAPVVKASGARAE
jgi:tripartite-type tricarboxylate transporter receptor subunit TctC